MKKLRVLIVEDDPQRYDIFDKVFEHHDVTKSTRAAPACTWLRGRATFDLIMLDHDLEPGHYERVIGDFPPIGQGTGQEVAHQIARLAEPPTVVVHSWNPSGGDAICAILADAGVPHHRIWFSETIGHDLRRFGIIPEDA